MGSLLHRSVRTYVLQGHSVQNTSLESSLCIVKLPVLLALQAPSGESRMGPVLWAWLAMQVTGSLFGHCLQTPHAHTLPPGTHTQEHAAVPLFLWMLPTISPRFCLDLISRLSFSSHLTFLNSCLGFSPLRMAFPQGVPLCLHLANSSQDKSGPALAQQCPCAGFVFHPYKVPSSMISFHPLP